MRIAIVGSRGIPAHHGGDETLAEELAKRLSARGVEVTVVCEASKGGRPMRLGRIRLEYVSVLFPGLLGRVLYDLAGLIRCRKNYDVVYLLGYRASFACWIPRYFGRRVWIHMGRSEGRNPKWGAFSRRWMTKMEAIAGRVAHRLIFDNHARADEALEIQHPQAQVSILASGASVVVKTPGLDALHLLGLEAQRYHLMVCRFEPENHVLEVVRAAAARADGAPLVVVSDAGERTRWQRDVMALAGDLVRFVGPIYDPEVLRALRFHCQIHIHGHSLGGTNPSLLEAMGCGNFILAHDNPYNREVLGPMGQYFTDESDLFEILQHAEHSRERQRRMVGDGARDRAMNLYTWDQVTAGYLELLQHDVNRGLRPVHDSEQDQTLVG